MLNKTSRCLYGNMTGIADADQLRVIWVPGLPPTAAPTTSGWPLSFGARAVVYAVLLRTRVHGSKKTFC